MAVLGDRATGLLDFLGKIGGSNPPMAQEPTGPAMFSSNQQPSLFPQGQVFLGPTARAVEQAPVMPDMNQGGLRLTADQLQGRMAPPAPAMTVQTPVEGDGMIDKAKSTMGSLYDSTLGNDEWRIRKALALNSMRLNPDDSLAAGLREQLKTIQSTRGANVTAQKLREMGKPELAAMVEAGQLTGKEAYSLATKNPTELQQMMELYKTNPEMLQSLAQMGVFGGDVDMGQGDYLKAIAGSFSKRIDGYNERADNARNLLNGLQDVQRLLGQTDTGQFQETKLAWGETLQRYGFDVDTSNIGNMQALRAATNQLVAQELRKNKGPQTDFDAEFTGRFLPGLGQTQEANQQIVKYLSSTQRLELVLGNMASDALTGKFDVDRTNMKKIDELKRNAPAVIPTQQGGYVHFSTFYQNAIQQGKSDAEIMDAWTTLAGGR